MGKFKELWQRSKDGERRGERSFLRCVIVSTFLCILFLLLKRDNLISWIEARSRIREQNSQIEYLEKEIGKVVNKTRMLETNRDSLEQFARENYDFIAPGEEMFVAE